MIARWMNYARQMGPAWIVSAVACGPATLASVAIAGSTFGYELLWVVVLSAVFGTTAQYLAARIGILEGRGIISAATARLGKAWGWILAVDAVLATYLAAMVLMNALVGVTGLITGL
ncbi:MAG: divalent metal cation transporter, partial [Proteobacteria bacterium]|nr:divalent metal cation transporter [Pseudomonadota bacterium]